MRLLLAIYVLAAGIIPSGQSYLKQLQQRDSILIADQLEYGVELNGVEASATLAFQDYTKAFTDTLTLVGAVALTIRHFGHREGDTVHGA